MRGWEEGGVGGGVTVIYVITYQMKQEGCVNQRVNTQLDKSIHPLSMCVNVCRCVFTTHPLLTIFNCGKLNHFTVCAMIKI